VGRIINNYFKNSTKSVGFFVFLDSWHFLDYTETDMKTLILGSQGGLGTQLIKIFAAPDLLTWDKAEADFLNIPDLLVKLDIAKPDVVINAVAYNAVDKCETDPEELDIALKLNFDLPRALAQWCDTNKATLIHYSTDYVFSGSLDKSEFVETDATNPINKYGETKAMGEKAILDYPNLKYYIIRLSKLFGPKGSSAHTKASFFDIMLNLAQTNSELKVVDEELSCFTYSPDLAEATYQLLNEKYEPGIYHLTNSGSCTWYEGVLALKELAGLTVEVKPILGADLKRAARRPEFSVLKNTKFPALRNYQEALKEYLNK
jgi:dTDP-4-dehydrorhamnose reductase